mmetsp:Transcript_101235/g.292748  ORF Transcript_101235/g.292748 Transcript_101235/m.292748 type:complete len:202 (-) Transcript_101235:37-642(-)
MPTKNMYDASAGSFFISNCRLRNILRRLMFPTGEVIATNKRLPLERAPHQEVAVSPDVSSTESKPLPTHKVVVVTVTVRTEAPTGFDGLPNKAADAMAICEEALASKGIFSALGDRTTGFGSGASSSPSSGPRSSSSSSSSIGSDSSSRRDRYHCMPKSAMARRPSKRKTQRHPPPPPRRGIAAELGAPAALPRAASGQRV